MKEILKVTGMHCHHCEAKIVKNVVALEGVQSCSASHVEEKVEIEYDDTKLDLKQIKKCIKKCGFKVR